MSKFKVGDKVECVSNVILSYNEIKIKIGDTFTIIDIQFMYESRYKLDAFPYNWFSLKGFELAKSQIRDEKLKQLGIL